MIENMITKDDSDNWLNYPEKLEPLKNFPLWIKSNEIKEERKKII